MTTAPPGAAPASRCCFPPTGGAGRTGSARASPPPSSRAAKPIDEQMDHHERLRLLYVAVHPRPRPPRRLAAPQGRVNPPKAELDAHERRAAGRRASPTRCGLPDSGGGDRPARRLASQPPPSSPPFAEWEAERASRVWTALARPPSRRPRSPTRAGSTPTTS